MIIEYIGDMKVERDWEGNWDYTEYVKPIETESKLEYTLQGVELDD